MPQSYLIKIQSTQINSLIKLPVVRYIIIQTYREKSFCFVPLWR